MLGILYSLFAGIFISLQSVFNTRVSNKIGLWETTVVVHAIGFAFAFIIMLIWGNGNFKKLESVNKLYLLGGAFGVLIIYRVMNVEIFQTIKRIKKLREFFNSVLF